MVLKPVTWLILFVILLVLELMTVGLFTIWFAIGALAGLGICLAGYGFWPQITGFLAVSALMLFLTRPLAVKYLNKNLRKNDTDKMTGKEALVVQEINNLEGSGRVLLNGMDWMAVSEQVEEVIPVNEKVIICAVSGIKLVVRKKEEN